jgi:hypothetical protein
VVTVVLEYPGVHRAARTGPGADACTPNILHDSANVGRTEIPMPDSEVVKHTTQPSRNRATYKLISECEFLVYLF